MDIPRSYTLTILRTALYPLLFFGLLCINPHVQADDHELVVITHPENPSSTLNFNTLRAIYSMRMQTWPDGSPVKVFILSDGDEAHKEFCRNTLKTLPRYLRKNWDRQVFSGKAQAPKVVKSLAAMKQKIAVTPGAIGYIERGEVDEDVIVVSISD